METVVRVFLVYLVIMIALRLMGKREFGQLSPLELVSLLLIPELVSGALVREDYSLTNAVIAVSTLLALVFLTSVLGHKSETMSKIIDGTPSVLVQNGTIIESNMNRERITPGELMSEIHKTGLYKVSQVKWAILESDGKIAVIPKKKAATGIEKMRGKDEVKTT